MCGIFGVTHHPEASNLTYLGLYALQHRGQESAGIVSADGEDLYKVRKRKQVSDSFDESSFNFLKGEFAIGHVRYSTTGGNSYTNVQPFQASGKFGKLAVAHNGNLTNYFSLKKVLEDKGIIFQSTSDTEILLHLVAQSSAESLVDKIEETVKKVDGAFSLLFLTKDSMFAVRDPHGFRPLILGKVDNSYVFSSESCAFDLIGAEYIREVEPGELIEITADGKLNSRKYKAPAQANCVFEHIYFARPDSLIFNETAYEVRKNLGRELAKENKIEADFVIPVPDSGNFAALGFSEQSGIPFEFGFIRNHYIGRTFIEPKQSIRGFGVKVKLNPVKSTMKGKRVVVIDDSIVRGTTSKKIIKMLRDAGAKEVTLLISSPPFIKPCFYGIDTPSETELIAANHSMKEICDYIGADNLAYLTIEGMFRAIKKDSGSFCKACFTGKYPTAVDVHHLAN
ncbi:MAG: amidophosphoribosyltransferase [Proteobacteria bacterium]|nr:amidophosphoribosyltransferase [Pseudomonadota bacterium]